MAQGGNGRNDRTPTRPAGFPRCARCPYLTLERPDVCLACAVGGQRPAPGRRCPVCDQATGVDGRCDNDWCGRADRWFSSVWAIAAHTAALRRTIAVYKYGGRLGWAEVLARILVGYLDEHMPWFEDYDIITTVPVYTGPGARRPWDHLALIVEAADRLAGPWWPFERNLVVKCGETPAMAGLSRQSRRVCAESRLRSVLLVPDPGRVAGRRILVVDDVLTEGSTLREVARALVLAGAVEVAGVVLARQPWGGSRRPTRALPRLPAVGR